MPNSNDKKKINICVLMGGQPRFNEQTINLIKENILGPINNEKYNILLIISTDYEYLASWNNLNWGVPSIINITKRLNYQKSNMKNIGVCQTVATFHQFRHLYSGVLSITQLQTFRADYVIKIRSDFLYHTPIKPSYLDNLCENEINVCLYEVQHKQNISNTSTFCPDQFYISKPNTLKKIYKTLLFDTQMQYDKNHGQERNLKLSCDYCGVKIKHINDFSYDFIRQLYEPFVQIRNDTSLWDKKNV